MTSSPRRRFRRSTVIPLLLLVYLAVMAYIGWPEYASGRSTGWYYFGIIGATLLVITLLHFSLKRRETLREKREAEDAAAMRRKRETAGSEDPVRSASEANVSDKEDSSQSAE